MYYVTETTDLNATGKDAAPVYEITTEAPRTNMSGEVRTDGWLGTTNNFYRAAHGEFETEEEARAKVAELGGEVEVEVETYGDPECKVVAAFTTLEGGRDAWDACDWFAEDLKNVTAEVEGKTNKQIAEIAARYEAEAADVTDSDRPYGCTIVGCEKFLRNLRDECA